MRLWLLWALLVFPFTAHAVDFVNDVKPIFAKRCQGCHGAAQQMSGLRLDDGAAALAGGNSGTVIVPGKAADSKLIERVTSDKKGFMMPPMGAKLTEAEVAVLRGWIVTKGRRCPRVRRPRSNEARIGVSAGGEASSAERNSTVSSPIV